MLDRAIPSTQERIPVIGLGSWQTFDVDLNNPTPLSVLKAFIQGGGVLVDSSPMYGKAETAIGYAVQKLDLVGKVFLATKVWTSGKDEGIRQMESSFRKLRTDRIDLMQVHNLVDVETHLNTLAEWKSAGRLRYIGVTHYTASAHAAVEKVLRAHSVDFLQINYSLAERDAERRLLPLAAELGVAVIVNRPFAEGVILKRLRGRALPNFAKEIDCSSWAQLALKFVISHPAVTCVIPATTDPSHLNDFVQAGTERQPDEKMREAIVAAAR